MDMGQPQTMPWAERQADEVIGVGRYVRVGGVGAVTVLFVTNLPVRRFAREDVVGLRAELAVLESMDLLTQADVARAGLFPEATFHRDCVAFRAGGEAAVRARTIRGSRGPRKLLPAVAMAMRSPAAPSDHFQPSAPVCAKTPSSSGSASVSIDGPAPTVASENPCEWSSRPRRRDM